ncbi:MAG TPA: hypothetical protein DCR93_01745 [Cytophagales bacterium]|nr:hypothetical protein [Cytophagales bacterium]HAP58275.1 hypothetical protein [Cytophagales bacterium]
MFNSLKDLPQHFSIEELVDKVTAIQNTTEVPNHADAQNSYSPDEAKALHDDIAASEDEVARGDFFTQEEVTRKHALQEAIQAGIESGQVEDFDPKAHLTSQKTKRASY